MISECKGKIDLALAIDASGSVGKDNYQNLKDFLKLFVSRFTLSESETHVALLHYDHRVFVDFDFNDDEATDSDGETAFQFCLLTREIPHSSKPSRAECGLG